VWCTIFWGGRDRGDGQLDSTAIANVQRHADS
jgi:hypothetical protein